MENIKNTIKLPKADIVFAPHHGRNSGRIPQKWLNEMDAQIIVLGEAPPKDLNYDYSKDCGNTITQNTAEDILFEVDRYIDIHSTNASAGYSKKGWVQVAHNNHSGLNYLGSIKQRES